MFRGAPAFVSNSGLFSAGRLPRCDAGFLGDTATVLLCGSSLFSGDACFFGDETPLRVLFCGSSLFSGDAGFLGDLPLLRVALCLTALFVDVDRVLLFSLRWLAVEGRVAVDIGLPPLSCGSSTSCLVGETLVHERVSLAAAFWLAGLFVLFMGLGFVLLKSGSGLFRTEAARRPPFAEALVFNINARFPN